MATYAFDRVVSPSEFAETLQKELGEDFDIEISGNNVKVVQSKWICCVIRVREKDGRLICKGPFGLCPSSTGARMAIIFGLLAVFIVIGLSVGYVTFPLLPAALIGLLIAKVPPRELVGRVKRILGEATNKA